MSVNRPKASRSGDRRSGRRRHSPAVEAMHTLHSELEAAATKLADITVSVTEPSDPFGAVGEAFADELRALLGDEAPDPGVARRAARLAVAEQVWAQRVGTLLETRDVVQLLGVSKQRVSTLAGQHRLIALPQTGRLRFPAWQFAVPDADDRECLAAAHHRLVVNGAVSPWTASSWFAAKHPELDDRDPVGYLRAGGDRERLLRAATRDAERLGQ